jgi:HEAT repeat protein
MMTVHGNPNPAFPFPEEEGVHHHESETEHEALLAEVQGMLPPWLPMMECLQSPDVPLPRKLDTLKRLKPHVLGISGFRIIPPLIGLLRHSRDATFCLHLVKLLGELRTQAVQHSLVDVALGIRTALFEKAPAPFEGFLEREEVIRLRCSAIRMLGLSGESDAMVPLMSLLNDESLNYRVRLEAAESLGRLKNAQALNPLIAILKHRQPSSLYLQESAVKALGMLGDIRALDPLLELFEQQQGFRQKCQFLVERILGSVSQLVEQSQAQHSVREKALTRVLSALEDEAPSIRVAATEALSTIGDAAHLPLLHQRLFDAEMEVAHAALVGVYSIGGLEELKQLLNIEELPRFLRDEILDFLILEADEALPYSPPGEDDMP